MPKPLRCTFCGHEFNAGTGMIYVKNDGSVLRFCSSKCRKSALDLKRDPRKLKWTGYYQKEERSKI